MSQVCLSINNHFLRLGVEKFLSNHTQFNVVCNTNPSASIHQFIFKQKFADVLITDSSLTNDSILDLLQLIGKGSRIKLISIINSADLKTISFLLNHKRINGIISELASPNQLLLCLEEVLKGKRYIDSSMPNLNQSKNEVSKLSKSEFTVFMLISNEYKTKQIANFLNVSSKTIENHRSNICKKLNISGVNAINNYIYKNKESIFGG